MWSYNNYKYKPSNLFRMGAHRLSTPIHDHYKNSGSPHLLLGNEHVKFESMGYQAL